MRPQPSTSTGISSPASTSSAIRGFASAAAQPEVVAQVALGGDAERPRGDPQQLALGLLGAGVGAARTAAGSTRSGRS